MARGEDEAIPIEPLRVRWIALEHLAKEDRAHFRRTEGKAEVAF